MRITENRNPLVGEVGSPLINGKTYYYAVKAEGYLEFADPQIIYDQTLNDIVRTVPHFNAGARYQCTYGDEIEDIRHTVIDAGQPISDGQVIVRVIDPSRVTGLEYSVHFNEDSTWNLFNAQGDSLLIAEPYQAGQNFLPLVDGLEIEVVVPLGDAKPNTVNDVFSFSAPAPPEKSSVSAKTDLDKIRVVPNPYYGYHSGEMSSFERWVQFTYLPNVYTIRIFDLSGHPVIRFDQSQGSEGLLKWNLLNRQNSLTGSGVYVYVVEVPGVGRKVGKLAIFQSLPR